MFVFASVALNVLPVAGLEHPVIAQPNLSQCFIYVHPENVFFFFNKFLFLFLSNLQTQLLNSKK